MKTWKDIEEAAMFDTVLQAAVHRHRHGELTREEALIMAALQLARIRVEQHQELVKMISELPATVR